jgi:hypothetical protein
MKRIYQKLPIFSFQGVIALLGGFVFSFNKVNPGRQIQKFIALAYTEMFFACG